MSAPVHSEPRILPQIAVFTLLLTLAACSQDPEVWIPPQANVAQLQGPEGVRIEIYANAHGARSLALGPPGIVFVGTGGWRHPDKEGRVWVLVDADDTNVAESTLTLASGLDNPNGVAYRDGDLYVAERHRILRFPDVLPFARGEIATPPEPEVLFDGLPRFDVFDHSWKHLAIGPDARLYLGIGAPCNICLPDRDRFAGIFRLNLDGSGFEQFARGVRETVGFDWHPETGELWFSDNGRDHMSADLPPDELNHAPRSGMDFGYPFCHAGTIEDPELGDGSCATDRYVAPTVTLEPHVAPLGIAFYDGGMFPEYEGDLFIAEHGGYFHRPLRGFRVARVHDNGEGAEPRYDYVPFVTGWLNPENSPDGMVFWGSPVDVVVAWDGALLVSDDKRGLVYRISRAQ